MQRKDDADGDFGFYTLNYITSPDSSSDIGYNTYDLDEKYFVA
jgi:hypothetical protein